MTCLFYRESGNVIQIEGEEERLCRNILDCVAPGYPENWKLKPGKLERELCGWPEKMKWPGISYAIIDNVNIGASDDFAFQNIFGTPIVDVIFHCPETAIDDLRELSKEFGGDPDNDGRSCFGLMCVGGGGTLEDSYRDRLLANISICHYLMGKAKFIEQSWRYNMEDTP